MYIDKAEEEAIDSILAVVKGELIQATGNYGSFKTAHEGYAVILEELDELWDIVKTKDQDRMEMMSEAKQVAAMAVRFIYDVCLGRGKR